MIRALTLALLLWGLAWPGVASARGRIIVARETHRLQPDGDVPLAYPTDVAVGPGGVVWVADGVNRRVVGFDAQGQVTRIIRQVDGVDLRQPAAVSVDDDGGLWIVDGARVAVIPAAPGRERFIEPPGDELGPLDATGVAVAPRAGTLWIVDNDGHRLLRCEPYIDAWMAVGEPGYALGKLHNPFLVDVDGDGLAYVSDVLNGRIQVFSAEGLPVRSIGSYGIRPGQLYRPKGVAISGDRVWVSDSVLGLIQVFTTEGHFLGVLRDEQGEILALDAPTGLDVHGDQLWVVELAASRVRGFTIGHALGQPLEAASLAGTHSLAGQDRECTVCHLELFPTLERGLRTALVSPPPNTAEQPWVSRSANCLSCHDGTVMDSRREVWAMMGHAVDREPAEGMEVPEHLPLSDGWITCRTCHSAHTLGGSGQLDNQSLFLRVDTVAEELCFACHPGLFPEGSAP